MGVIKDSLTFDDVSLVPQHSSVLPSETDTFTELSGNLNLQIPLISSAMDTVTESKMAITIGKSGGLGIIHKNLNPKNQALEVKKVKKNNIIVGAAVGTNEKDIDRVYKLLESKVFNFCLLGGFFTKLSTLYEGNWNDFGNLLLNIHL